MSDDNAVPDAINTFKLASQEMEEARISMLAADKEYRKATLELDYLKRVKEKTQKEYLFFLEDDESDLCDETIAGRAHFYLDACDDVKKQRKLASEFAALWHEKSREFSAASLKERQLRFEMISAVKEGP